MTSFSKQWKWGSKPPKWVMREFETALTLMGRNNEVIHFFDVSPLWTFCVAIMPTNNVDRMSQLLRNALSDSQTYFTDCPRIAVYGDLFP